MIMSENANSRYSSKNPSKYQTLMIQLHERFPGLEESDFVQLGKKFRDEIGTLKGMTVEDVAEGMAQLCENTQEQTLERTSSETEIFSTSRQETQKTQEKQKTQETQEKHPDAPCAICFESMKNEEVVDISCGHQFHESCLRNWVNRNSTCPTCRNYVLMPEDYPKL